MPPVSREDPTYRLRHSAAHVLAQAVTEMFPGARLGWGPPHDRFENGFYYDFGLPRPLTPGDRGAQPASSPGGPPVPIPDRRRGGGPRPLRGSAVQA
jgi:hypothetical protein